MWIKRAAEQVIGHQGKTATLLCVLSFDPKLVRSIFVPRQLRRSLAYYYIREVQNETINI